MHAETVNHRTCTVHVTGYDGLPEKVPPPYEGIPFNPAGAIVKLLPLELPAAHILNTSGMDIKLVGPGSDGLPASYSGARDMLKKLHEVHGATIDLWIHLGTGPWTFMTCERRALGQEFTSSWLREQDRDDGYYLYPDAKDQTVRDIGPSPWTHVPVGLHSEVPIDETVAHANTSLTNYYKPLPQQPLQVVTHLEGGSNGCGFAFYESMANCFTAGRKRDVVFVHVPARFEKADLERARDGTLAIIGGAIAAIFKRDSEPPKDLKDEFGDSR